MPILLAGGVGGTLYHATRASRIYFLLDVVPISVLGLAGAVFMALRYWGRRGWWFVPAVVVFYIAVNGLLFAAMRLDWIARTILPVDDRVLGQLRINLSYASLAVIVLTPMALVLFRTRFRYVGWVVAGVISFTIAWFFRLVDPRSGGTLPMGSHWLWHTFGAISTALRDRILLPGGRGEDRARQAGTGIGLVVSVYLGLVARRISEGQG